MSISPLNGGMSPSSGSTEEPLGTGGHTPPASSGTASYLNLDFLKVSSSALGIAAAIRGGNTSVLIAQVMAENAKLLLNNATNRSGALSGQIQKFTAQNAEATEQQIALAAEIDTLNGERGDLVSQREALQSDRSLEQGELNTLNSLIDAKQNLITAQDELIHQLDAALAALDEEGTELSARDALQDQIASLTTHLAQLQTELAALEDAMTPDAGDVLRDIGVTIDGALAQLQADLAALGENGDPNARAALEAQIVLLAALAPELQAVIAGLEPDENAGGAQTLEGFATAIKNAVVALENEIDDLSFSPSTGDPAETAGSIAVLQAQVAALTDLAAQVDTRLETMTGTEEVSPSPDPGAVEGLRIVANLLFGSMSSIEGQIAASAQRDHSADRSLERSIVSLNDAIASLEAERDALGEEATPEEIDAFAADIASLQNIIIQLQAERTALPDTTGVAPAAAYQAEIDALAATSDRLADTADDEGISRRVQGFLGTVTTLLGESVGKIQTDIANLDDAEYLATQNGTFVGRASTASALSGLIIPLGNRATAYTDGSQAATKTELEAQIGALVADISMLQAQLDSLDPEDEAGARVMLENQREAAIALKGSTEIELTTLDGQKPSIEARLSNLDSQIVLLDQSIIQKDAQIASKQDELDKQLNDSSQLVVSSSNATQIQGQISASNLFMSLESQFLDAQIEKLTKLRNRGGRPARWTQQTPEERSVRPLDDGMPRPVIRRPPTAEDIQRAAGEELAFSVAAVSNALKLLMADVPDQPEPKREKFTL